MRLSRTLRHMMRQRLSSSWRSWALAARWERGAEAQHAAGVVRLSRTLRHMMRQRLSSSWRSWVELLAGTQAARSSEAVLKRILFRSAVTRWTSLRLRRGWRALQRRVKEVVLMTGCLERMANVAMGAAAQACGRALRALQRNVQHHKMLFERTRQDFMVSALMREAKEKADMQAKAGVKRACALWRRGLLGQGWSRLVGRSEATAKLHRLLRRMRRPRLAQAWAFWAAGARCSVSTRRVKVILVRSSVARWVSLRLRWAWRKLRQRVREVVLVLRCLRRMLAADKATSTLACAQGFRRLRLFGRGVVASQRFAAVFGRHARRDLAFAWRLWQKRAQRAVVSSLRKQAREAVRRSSTQAAIIVRVRARWALAHFCKAELRRRWLLSSAVLRWKHFASGVRGDVRSRAVGLRVLHATVLHYRHRRTSAALRMWVRWAHFHRHKGTATQTNVAHAAAVFRLENMLHLGRVERLCEVLATVVRSGGQRRKARSLRRWTQAVQSAGSLAVRRRRAVRSLGLLVGGGLRKSVVAAMSSWKLGTLACRIGALKVRLVCARYLAVAVQAVRWRLTLGFVRWRRRALRASLNRAELRDRTSRVESGALRVQRLVQPRQWLAKSRAFRIFVAYSRVKRSQSDTKNWERVVEHLSKQLTYRIHKARHLERWNSLLYVTTFQRVKALGIAWRRWCVDGLQRELDECTRHARATVDALREQLMDVKELGAHSRMRSNARHLVHTLAGAQRRREAALKSRAWAQLRIVSQAWLDAYAGVKVRMVIGVLRRFMTRQLSVAVRTWKECLRRNARMQTDLTRLYVMGILWKRRCGPARFYDGATPLPQALNRPHPTLPLPTPNPKRRHLAVVRRFYVWRRLVEEHNRRQMNAFLIDQLEAVKLEGHSRTDVPHARRGSARSRNRTLTPSSQHEHSFTTPRRRSHHVTDGPVGGGLGGGGLS